ncbi:ParB/RepB/Spo0J family partition protein [Halobacteria archaeon AArc-m2/3/4]|uniref:ParB/RepB/Spo0J family partition protein n=1 Tax=Natronoglomus mannanivorans TaxID=2979990 RepID=A0ABT2QIZ1_9EURY|nr:ParB/RepB/Spo0J family partition protein [Halobacteria archaeon AArc-m2/3/4]
MDYLTDLEKDILFLIGQHGEITQDSLQEELNRVYSDQLDKENINESIASLFNSQILTRNVNQQNSFVKISEHGEMILRSQQNSFLKRGYLILKNEGVGELSRRLYRLLYQNAPPSKITTIRRTCNRYRYTTPVDPLKTYWIKPSSIRFRTNQRFFSNKNDRGKVTGGSWDLQRFDFEVHPIFVGLEERFKDGKEWHETAYYHWAGLHIDAVGRFFGCTSREEFVEKRCAFVESLYTNIRTDGYKTQEEAEFADSNRRHQTVEMTVNVGRNGEFLVYDGHHRLAIAKLLDIDEIPVNILVRHADWQSIRDEVAHQNHRETLSENVAQHLPHPDLTDLVNDIDE